MALFKNTVVYSLDEGFEKIALDEFRGLIEAHPLRKCGEHDLETLGFVPVFGEGGALVEEVNGAYFIKLGIEEKKISRKVIKTGVERYAEKHEIDISQRARYKEIEELVLDRLISTTYPERRNISACIDWESRLLIVDASSEKNASTITAVLRRALSSLPIQGYAPQVDMPTVMTHWVDKGLPNNAFSFLDEIELEELSKEEGGKTKITGVIVDASPEVWKLISEMWDVTRLGLVFQDEVSFIVDKNFQVKRLKYLDRFSDQLEPSEGGRIAAQSRAFLFIGTFRKLIHALFNMCYA